MPPRFRDARTGESRALISAVPPRLALSLASGGAATLEDERRRQYAGALESSLRHLGFEPSPCEPEAAELHFGAAKPAGAALWLKPGAGPAGALPSGRWSPTDLRLWALRRPYGEDVPASFAGELSSAAEEGARLRSAAAALSARASGMPNAAGLAGYRKRLRDALGADFDTPAALACVWDSLRPGALSPPSQLAALREADAALGLSLF